VHTCKNLCTFPVVLVSDLMQLWIVRNLRHCAFIAIVAGELARGLTLLHRPPVELEAAPDECRFHVWFLSKDIVLQAVNRSALNNRLGPVLAGPADMQASLPCGKLALLLSLIRPFFLNSVLPCCVQVSSPTVLLLHFVTGEHNSKPQGYCL
jgi:hypothetical protein